MSSPYWVYIIRCRGNLLYTGVAKDLKSRLEMHLKGKGSKFVRANLPFELVYKENLPDKSTALKREIEIKSMKKTDKELLIKNGIQSNNL